MIRTLLIAAAFLILTVALIAVQPGTRPSQQAAGFGDGFDSQVSRGETVLDDLAAASPAAIAQPIATPSNQMDRPTPRETPGLRPRQAARLSHQEAVDLLAARRNTPQATVARAAPVIVAPTTAATPARMLNIEQSGSLDSLTAGVLAGLGVNTAVPQPTQAEMRDITSGVLSNITSITGRQITPEKSPLQQLVTDALREGQSDEYIDTLLNEAAFSGAVRVPAALVTSDGRVDTSVLLKSIVTKATGETVDIETVGGDGVEVRVVQRAEDTEKFRFYTVAAGDSLGSIAIKFYGDFDRYSAIYEANRQILSSPDRIRRGQRLVIPTG